MRRTTIAAEHVVYFPEQSTQQRFQLLLLPSSEVFEQLRLPSQHLVHKAFDCAMAGFGQFDVDLPCSIGTGMTDDQTLLLRTIDALSDRPSRDERRAGELPGAETVRRPGSAKRRQQIEDGRVGSGLPQQTRPIVTEQLGYVSNSSHDGNRVDGRIRALSRPRKGDRVDGIIRIEIGHCSLPAVV